MKDPVHDYIMADELISTFMDTPQFQRLRSIKQLGTSYFVWPGASHNRFEHCLGVAHLARLMAEHLQKSQPELDITDRDVQCVQLAGLCHDLGHGPWSHVWDSLFIPKALKGKSWHHEDASEMMFDDLIKQNEIQFSEEDATFVKALIAGEPARCGSEKTFLFEIVANKRNGIDVDKFDYIARDCHAIGEKGNLSLTRLINSARVIDNQICYDIKDANQLYELSYTRFSLHKRIYNHKTAKSVEYMIIDALLAAEPYLKIAEQVDKPEKYVFLTDDIMPTIERSTEPELAESRAIFKRLRLRDLYKCVDYKVFRYQDLDVCRQHLTPERIAEAARRLQQVGTITADDVIVDLTTMHYGMKEKNPLDFINFYSKSMPNKCTSVKEGDVSMLMPISFAEVFLRVFTKDSQHFGVVQAAYREVLKTLPSPDDIPATVQPMHTDGPLTAPSTPHSKSASLPGIDNTVTPKTTTSTTPISRSANSFTAVPLNHAPTSPHQNYRRTSASRKRDRDVSGPVTDEAGPLKKKK
ncbi:HD-domain/PDEase-like protein [Athelia psychrophila]|uniref:HD-domain/PDEase-like protein n=1 Tax=Athelia psychrophila TaxID=1759441 RepID=A0A166HQH5_9AGAM|nr:HD-domain/PDEase-like protein [Fibularhizoctonia sp. CBS 109695]